MNRTLRHGTSFQKIGALCAGVAHVLAASLATRLVPHRALATPGDRVQKRTRIPWTLILAVLLPAASSLGQTPPGDSYLCYKAALAPGQATFTPVQKGLQDQFGMLVVDVKRVLAVCNPAQTAVHQVGYKIARAKTPPQPVFVKTDHTAIDQFGAHALTLLQPVELRAPSAQVLGAGGTGLVDTTGVDHFECYKAVPARNAPTFVAPPPVAITDEFGTVTLTLNKITKLCTPVNTNGEDVTASQHVGHLVCYQAKLPQGTRFAPQTVSVNNTNFGPAVLVAKAVAELCVPAFKDAIPTTTTSTTTTTLDCFTDTGDGTIHDTCTGLQWEKKDGSDGTPNAGDLHDVDNRYSWAGLCTDGALCQPDAAAAATCAALSDGGTWGCSTCASGTCSMVPCGDYGCYLGLTTVWDWINQVNAANFAGHSDWRLPSEGGCNSCWSAYSCSSCSAHELETILGINAIFGPTNNDAYWSASTIADVSPMAWWVSFPDGRVNYYSFLYNVKSDGWSVRAVR